MALKNAELINLKDILLTLKSSLDEALQQAEASTQPVELDQQAFGRVSRVDALQQQAMAKAGEVQNKTRLREVLKALSRCDSGDYGYCLDCDESIDYRRLKVRPETLYCLACQSQREDG